jgi:CheY-like chemotaxis protein
MKAKEKLNIIVVEDNLLYQELIAKQLPKVNHEVHFFTKGETCVESLSALDPDILVLDYNLDGQMTGLDTLKSIRSFFPDTFAVLFSSQKGLNTDENFREYGRFEYIEKRENSFSHLKQVLACI